MPPSQKIKAAHNFLAEWMSEWVSGVKLCPRVTLDVVDAAMQLKSMYNIKSDWKLEKKGKNGNKEIFINPDLKDGLGMEFTAC